MKTDLLSDSQEYVQETYEDFYNRFNGFGKEIFNKLKIELPYVFENLTLYKAIKSTGKHIGGFQPLDSYAIFDDENIQFVIQLEPLSEVICLFNDKTGIEIGYWSEDEYRDAINFIKQNFITI